MTWLHPSCKGLTRGSDSCEQLDDFVTEWRKVAGFSLSVSGMHPRGHWAFLTILVGFPLIISIGSNSFSAKHVHPVSFLDLFAQKTRETIAAAMAEA